MKKLGWLAMCFIVAALAGCSSSIEENDQYILCQQEKQQLQSQLAMANETIGQKDEQLKMTIQQKDQQIEKLQAEVREVNQKALESIRTMMEKQNAKDVELKNKLKEQEALVKEKEALVKEKQAQVKQKETRIQELQQKVNQLQSQMQDAGSEPVETEADNL